MGRLKIEYKEPEFDYGNERKKILDHFTELENEGLSVKGILTNPKTAYDIIMAEGDWELCNSVKYHQPRIIKGIDFDRILIFASSQVEEGKINWVIN